LKSDIPLDPQNLADETIDDLASKYAYGPSPLTDAEIAHNEDIFHWKHASMKRWLEIAYLDRNATPEQRESAKREIAKIRGETK
jgi:predicted transcriptional regulator